MQEKKIMTTLFDMPLFLTGGNLGFILKIMSIINRYFRRQLLGIFVMLLLILTGLAWMMQIMSMMKFLINYGVSFSSFLYLISFMIPFIVSIIVPFITFIAVIFVYNKMISENEITVMASTGLSPWQIAKPAIKVAGWLTVLHLILNIWIVPTSQAKFYSTQWNLRYGLAHLKLQEAAFTKLADGLVVYVDNVSGHDLNQVMLSDMRDRKNQMLIFAERGKLVSTVHGLSIVTNNGSLQIAGNNNSFTTGTFDNFNMDLNLVENDSDVSFRVRRIPTINLLRDVFSQDSVRQHHLTLVELATRLINPFMNLILAIVCTLILLKSSLLRRRASFAPAVAVLSMAGIMAGYMSLSNMIDTISDFFLMVLGVFVLLFVLIGLLLKK
jgi:lipopolysaccharide export system permease protein